MNIALNYEVNIEYAHIDYTKDEDGYYDELNIGFDKILIAYINDIDKVVGTYGINISVEMYANEETSCEEYNKLEVYVSDIIERLLDNTLTYEEFTELKLYAGLGEEYIRIYQLDESISKELYKAVCKEMIEYQI